VGPTESVFGQVGGGEVRKKQNDAKRASRRSQRHESPKESRSGHHSDTANTGDADMRSSAALDLTRLGSLGGSWASRGFTPTTCTCTGTGTPCGSAGIGGGGVGAVGVGLEELVAQGLTLASTDGLHVERWVTGTVLGDGVADGEVDGLLVEIVLQDDDSVVEGTGLIENGLELSLGISRRDTSSVNPPVVAVELGAVGEPGPHNWDHTHSKSDGTHTIVYVTIRRAHGERSQAGSLLDR